jgi:hypothetical protein
VSSQTIHMVSVLDEDDFLERLRDEECDFEAFEDHVREASQGAFEIETETDLDVHRLLARLGVSWSEDAAVEDLDGVVKLLDPDQVENAAAKLEGLLEDPPSSARRLAAVLRELSFEVSDQAVERMAASLAEQDARATPEEDSEADAAAQVIVQHAHAMRIAAERGLWIATASYIR